jgi:hypothetical protein
MSEIETTQLSEIETTQLSEIETTQLSEIETIGITETKIIKIDLPDKPIKSLFEKNKEKNKGKKRVESKKWTFKQEDYEHDKQLKIIKNLFVNNYIYTDMTSKVIYQQINKKIYGYKQQDTIKKLFDKENFINIQSIITKMIDCELTCYYCCKEMLVLYDISREMKQWSVDRIDNDKGHNLDNYYLACLECNLKRRRRSDKKFLFTKQLKLIKNDSLIM